MSNVPALWTRNCIQYRVYHLLRLHSLHRFRVSMLWCSCTWSITQETRDDRSNRFHCRFYFFLALRLTDVLSVRNRNNLPSFFVLTDRYMRGISAMRAYLLLHVHGREHSSQRTMPMRKGLFYYCSIVFGRRMCFVPNAKVFVMRTYRGQNAYRASHHALAHISIAHCLSAAWNISVFVHKLNVVCISFLVGPPNVHSTDLPHHANEASGLRLN